MGFAPALLASLSLLLGAATEPLPCEEETRALADRVTRLENQVAADRDAENAAAASAKVTDAEFEALERRLVADEAELKEAWQALLAAQERCNSALGARPRKPAAEPSPVISLDVRAAWGVPVGSVWAGSAWNVAEPMTNAWTGALPLEVAARYRFTPNLSAGIYVGWGPAFVVSPGIHGAAPTSGSLVRAGLQGVYELLPGGGMNPWVLVGTGWEWASYTGPGFGVTMSGWQYLDLEAGLEFRLGRGFALGPYLGFAGGAYSAILATGSREGWGGAIPSEARAFHGWILLGVQGTASF